MNKHEQLQQLFQEVFTQKDLQKPYWGEKQESNFQCCNSEAICHLKKNQPKVTCYPGDETSKIMVIGEAPSSSAEYINTICGLFEKIESKKRSPQYVLREFVKNRYSQYPHFTDYIKCGVKNQKKDKKKLEDRQNPCFEKFLIKEFEIINPEIIFVCNKKTFNFLVFKKNEIAKHCSYFEMIYLYHYSYRGFNSLRNKFGMKEEIDDFKKRIWGYQTGDVIPKQYEKITVTMLKLILNDGKWSMNYKGNIGKKLLKEIENDYFS